MSYNGDSMGGFIGNFRTVALLETVRPARDNAGRVATVGLPNDTAAYYISQGAGWQPLVAAATDATTGAVSLVVGGVAIITPGKIAGLNAIFIGDSRTAQNFIAAGGVGYAPKWITFGNAMMGWPLNPVNGGVSGDTTAQMLVRLPALLAANPGDGWLVVRGMINDICSGNLVATAPTTGQVTKETIVTSLSAMIALGLAAGKKIAICTDVGNNASGPAPINAATAQGQLMRQAFDYVNRWVRATCVNTGYVLIDLEAALNDPATGMPVSGYMVADGVHISYVGSCAEARAFSAAFTGLLAVPTRTPSARLSPRNLIGPAASAAGTVSADAANDTRIIAPATATGLPNGWSVFQFRAGGAGAASKVAKTDYTPGTSAQLAFSSTASFGSTGFTIGGDSTNLLARWDQAWAVTTAYAIGRRINANGANYVCVTAGTTGGADPTAGWATTEGTLVTDGATFLCQSKPLSGELLQATIDLSFSSLSGNASPRIYLNFVDTAGTTYQTALCDLDLSGAIGIAGNYLPPSARFVSQTLALPNSNIRYLFISAGMYGENGSSANMVVHRAEILNLSRAAL